MGCSTPFVQVDVYPDEPLEHLLFHPSVPLKPYVFPCGNTGTVEHRKIDSNHRERVVHQQVLVPYTSICYEYIVISLFLYFFCFLLFHCSTVP